VDDYGEEVDFEEDSDDWESEKNAQCMDEQEVIQKDSDEEVEWEDEGEAMVVDEAKKSKKK